MFSFSAEENQKPQILVQSGCQLITTVWSDGVCAVLVSCLPRARGDPWLTHNIRSYAGQIIILCQATLPGMAGINSHFLSQTCKTENKKYIFMNDAFMIKNDYHFLARNLWSKGQNEE